MLYRPVSGRLIYVNVSRGYCKLDRLRKLDYGLEVPACKSSFPIRLLQAI